MTLGVMCGGPEEWGRMVANCPFCLARKRSLQALVFGGYGSSGICGGCGTRFYDGEGRFEKSPEKADEAIAFVRERWKSARRFRTILRESIANIS